MSENMLETKYNLIKQAAATHVAKDPIIILKDIMQQDLIGMHGPKHHFLDGAAFLAAFKNAGGAIDLNACLDELAKRTSKMPGAMCGHWGV